MKGANKTVFFRKMLSRIGLIRLIQPELSIAKTKKLIYLKCG